MSDGTTYQPVSENPTKQLRAKISKTSVGLQNAKKFTEEIYKWSISKTYKIIWAALAASSMAANWRVDKIFKLSFSQVPHSVSSYECTCESSTTVLKAPPPMSAINDFKLNTEMLAFLT